MNDALKASRRRGLLADDEEIPVRAKAETSLDRARRRAQELRGHMGDVADSSDEFYVPPDMVPEGWTYEWKRYLLFNKEDPSYTVQLAREGWEPVPVNRCKKHRAMMPQNWDKETIERHGMVLMERPEEITMEYRSIDYKRARQQVRVKEQQLASTPDGTLTRDDPRVAPKIRKGYEPIPIPEE